MEIFLGAVAALALFGGGTFLKNKVEDEITATSDAFSRWDSLFKKYGAIEGVPWTWLKAIAMNESSLGDHPSVRHGLEFPDDIEGSKSEDGKSWGLMQMTVRTARDYDVLASERKLNDPEYSVKLASKHVKLLRRLFDQTDPQFEEWVIKSYNQGQGNTKKEMEGRIDGYAEEYWHRYLRNRKIIFNKQGE